MTKQLLPAPGRIKIICHVVSIRNRRKYTSTEVGTNSCTNVARDYQTKIKNAKLNAIYKHMNKGGGSDAVVEVTDFDIEYFIKVVKIVKYEKVDKKGNKKRYAYAVSKTTGKRVNPARIIKNGDIEHFK